MKIVPKIMKGKTANFPVGATITIDDEEAAELANILSYAVRSDVAQVLFFKLAAVCEAINSDNEVGLDRFLGTDKKARAAYIKVRKLFDPEYGGGE